MKINLLDEKDLIKTGPVDHADWNYKSFIKYIQLKRFRLFLKLNNQNNHERLLEIGYGSGIFMPTLKKLASEVYGLDIHNKNKEVGEKLSKQNIKVNLVSASATDIPYEDNFFNLVLSISAIEFIDDLDKACKEISRVLKNNGFFIVITPGFSPILDYGLKVLTKQNAEKDYENRRKYIIPTLLKYFTIEERITFPKIANKYIRLYSGLKLSVKL